jgi:integral membrane protein (TIGR00529 family)
VCVRFFAALLVDSGRVGRFIDALSVVFKDPRLILVFIPSLIGLVPVVAGALISAPLIVKASDSLKLTSERRTFLNYWFRHAWEYTIPTYPGVIVSAAIMNCKMSKIAAVNLPLTLTVLLVGLTYGFYKILPQKADAAPEGESTSRRIYIIFSNIWPLLAVLAVTIGFSVHLFYPLIAAIAYMILRDKPTRSQLIKIVRDPAPRQMVYLVAGIISFKAMLEGTGMIELIGAEFSSAGIPPIAIIILLPFILGFLTGICLAYVGVTFPIIMPYFYSAAGEMHWGLFSLAYAAGYSGVLLSPLHLCLSTTVAYFRADIAKFYRILVLPVIFLMLIALLMAAID